MERRTAIQPYALAEGQGRTYEWHRILFTLKAASQETGGALSLWEVTTRKGEQPHTHTHDDADEIFYLLSGPMTFHCGNRSFKVKDHAFVFLPRGIPHIYTIHSKEVRLLGLSTPSEFADRIEQTGTLRKAQSSQRRAKDCQ